jgi:hypothetical protein
MGRGELKPAVIKDAETLAYDGRLPGSLFLARH